MPGSQQTNCLHRINNGLSTLWLKHIFDIPVTKYKNNKMEISELNVQTKKFSL